MRSASRTMKSFEGDEISFEFDLIELGVKNSRNASRWEADGGLSPISSD